jgi:hypothetical protein
MFIDKTGINEREYLCLLVILQENGFDYTLVIQDVLKYITAWMSRNEAIESLNTLGEKHLVDFVENGKRCPELLSLTGNVGITAYGLAFLINYANEYVEKINAGYSDLPDSLVASLIPFLELSSVPAADRFVRTSDNFPEFQRLEKELETIKLELIKDKNRNELPIPDKESVLADIDGVLAQIKDGMVRLSDLTTRIRPLVRDIADWCKDFMVIAGAAGAAYLAIQNILSKIF